MSKKKSSAGTGPIGGDAGLGGILKGLGGLVEKLGELAESGRELSETGSFGGSGSKELKGVYGFTVKVGLGDEAVKVEPFGNISRDHAHGRVVVHEVTAPAVDLFDEGDHILLVAEMPGVGAEDVHLTVNDDVLTIDAARRSRKYRKEIVLPRAIPVENMQVSCTNGVLEIRCAG
jgi:HSP20 family protein